MALDPKHKAKPIGKKLAGRTLWNGIPVSIEVMAGFTRSSKSGGWTMTHSAPYGYIRSSRGMDHDEIDVFLGPNRSSPVVHVIDLCYPNGNLDEQKFFLGFIDQQDAVNCFNNHYTDPTIRKAGKVSTLSWYEFAGMCVDKNQWGEYFNGAVVQKALAICPEFVEIEKSRQTPEAARRSSAKYAAKAGNKKKIAAKNKVLYMAKTGKKKKPSKCSKCGKAGPVQFHHTNYDKPTQGRYLCKHCHFQIPSYKESSSRGQKKANKS